MMLGSEPNRSRQSDSVTTATRAADVQSPGVRKRPSNGRAGPCTEKALHVTSAPPTRAPASASGATIDADPATRANDFDRSWMARTSSIANLPKSVAGSCVVVRAR